MSVRQSSGIRKRGPWAIAFAVTLIVAGIAYFAPENWSATAVGLIFLGATYWFCVAGATTAQVRACGLSLGGLFESESINFPRMARDTITAAKVALLTSLAIFPLFWLGFVIWWHPSHSFIFRGPESWNDELLGQTVVVALPEEAFYRGYLMNSFDQKDSRSGRILGAVIRPSLFWSSALFALGHFATEPNLTRLAVFFPALLFAWLRIRTGGIGAGVFFHVLCNVFASTLGRGYGLWP